MDKVLFLIKRCSIGQREKKLKLHSPDMLHSLLSNKPRVASRWSCQSVIKENWSFAWLIATSFIDAYQIKVFCFYCDYSILPSKFIFAHFPSLFNGLYVTRHRMEVSLNLDSSPKIIILCKWRFVQQVTCSWNASSTAREYSMRTLAGSINTN